MGRVTFLPFFLLVSFTALSQPKRVAILDFENISGIAKYDGLGKAMSSMLISDIGENSSSKKLQLVERAQIQKVLKEQNFQASSSVNKNTVVQAGKILGVNYLLIGDVFVLNDQLVINARLTNAETGDILFSKRQEGKILSWLQLKTGIANEIATKLNIALPVKSYDNSLISENSLLLYANGINYLDKNEIDSANKLLTELRYTEKKFNYTTAQLDRLFDAATRQTSNNILKQKAYILNLHKRISAKPNEAWQQIENFWNGPLDEKYPYLEYIFLKNVFEKFKNDSAWLYFPVSRHGVNTQLGDMLLFSISNHASLANEVKAAIQYNQIREKKFPNSEIAVIWGEPISPSRYRWELVDDPNLDTTYYKFLLLAQEATIFGLGSRNSNLMRAYISKLIPLLDLTFYDYIPSEYYYELEDKKIPIFNPYDVLGTLLFFVGTDEEKAQCKLFFAANSTKKLYTNTLQDQTLYKNQIKNDLLLKNAASWMESSFEDYKNGNWTNYDFSDKIVAQLCFISMDAICLQLLNKYLESYEILERLSKLVDKNISLGKEVLWAGMPLQKIYLIVQLRNCVALGKSDDVKYLSRQLALLGTNPEPFLSLHSEFLD